MFFLFFGVVVGFDKNVVGVCGFVVFGFGYVEVGIVIVIFQDGNLKL